MTQWISQSMNQWFSESLNQWISSWVDESTNQGISESMTECIGESMNQWNDKWTSVVSESTDQPMNEWTNEWMHGWMDGWTSELFSLMSFAASLSDLFAEVPLVSATSSLSSLLPALLLLWPCSQGPHYPKKRRVSRPRMFSPANSSASELLHFPTTWWRVVHMMMWLTWWCECSPWPSSVTRKFSN